MSVSQLPIPQGVQTRHNIRQEYLHVNRSNTLSGTRFAQIIGGNRERKRVRSLFNYISVADGIKIDQQNTPIAKGPLYVWSIGRRDTGMEQVEHPQNVLYLR